ncbi:type I-E CRISPR-associated protein Cse2/CasB [Rothia sp. ZJ932]|uniref:type I-E CRISPR-associated protein Cse2/CasB n=1 Tax=Rothia sp. ZJ932 TaxID=2810516 RepID=UPI0019680135|nr:type I-E CRISPR-associated protein Cse2/CasB [Rothia sp. ZJ932]QRZ61431.1 type I-E CRISPR-associated protein Cse2/CasB [Rothia sp. ZJ932]
MANTPTSTSEQSLSRFVTRKVNALYGSYSSGSSLSKKQLSELRKAVGQDPARFPLAWQYVISAEDEHAFPEDAKYRQGDLPTQRELAAFTALTLFAVHQQSEQRIMHAAGRSFGSAVGELVDKRTASIKKRFDSLLQARTYTAMSYHARSLVQLLKQEEIPFDYGTFSEDLAKLQSPKHRSSVITRWSRNFVYGFDKTSSQTPTHS